MIARKRLDIGWRDLALGLGACLRAGKPGDNDFCDSKSLVCLSVRSGFDLLLSALALPAGSEVLISVTIPAMPRILAEHGLIPVPVDLDMSTLSVTAGALRNAVTPQTKAIVVAHLFGSRMDMEPVLAVAREHHLFVIEDCAQAFAGPTFKGHPESDVRMFSFGPIKTATAVGGAVFFIRDAALRAEMEKRQATYPRQSRFGYFQRLLLFSFFKLLLAPGPYGGIIGLLRRSGQNHDEVVTGLGQSFTGPNFFAKIRHQPCAALRWLIGHRLRTYPVSQVEDRAVAGREVLSALPAGTVLGEMATAHSFWVFPIVTDAREELMQRLRDAGFDAASGATSLCAIEPPADRPAMRAQAAEAALARALYLPVYAALPAPERQRLAGVVLAWLKR
ncbi:MAG TPA: DegT/DnrJ/EryC1/StrS family aminotransferase [Chthoniobacter sp.]|jgi:dTDP-4-amino-4,6-dideoxygalactose transaminase